MSSILSRLLFRPVEKDHPDGRVIRFDQREANIHFVTGSMEERVISFMVHEDCPISAREIAQGINSNPSRVTQTLSRLMLEKRVTKIKLDGCVTQYCLSADNVK